MTEITPRIVMVHATALAMAPIAEAMGRVWPEAETINLLDESLSVDRAQTERLTPDLLGRIGNLTDHAWQLGADAVLFTCSAFGPAIETANREHLIPVLKPNEAMFEAALLTGTNIALLYTFAPAGASMAGEFRQAASAAGRDVTLDAVFVPDALEALRSGDAMAHDHLVAQVAAGLDGPDAIMLAQFSMARAQEAAQAVTRARVLTSPDAAAVKLKALLEQQAAGSKDVSSSAKAIP